MKLLTVSVFPYNTGIANLFQVTFLLILLGGLVVAASLDPAYAPELLAREAEPEPVAGGSWWGGKRDAVPEPVAGGELWGGKRDALPGGSQWSG